MNNSTATSTPERWNSRLGSILAMAGAAIGIGNFLRFPGLAAQFGGGAFMCAYLITLVLLGIPLSYIEWSLGRRSGSLGGHSLVSAAALLSRRPAWRYIGILCIVTPICISMYYLLIEAWILGYAIDTMQGAFHELSTAQVVAHFDHFTGSGTDGAIFNWDGSPLLYFFIIVLLFNAWLLYRGIVKGIEWFCKWSMPALIVSALLILLRVLTLDTPDPQQPQRSIDAGLGYMWNPNKTVLLVDGKTADMLPSNPAEREHVIQQAQKEHPGATLEVENRTFWEGLANSELWLAAAAQIFFSLGMGQSIAFTYASYVGRKEDIALTCLSSNAANEVMEVGVAGMMIIPAAVAFLGVAAAAGANTYGLGFEVLPQVFAAMPAGRFFGGLFFFLLFLAGMTSSLALIQSSVAFIKEQSGCTHGASVITTTFILLVGGLLISWYSGDGLLGLNCMDFFFGTVGVFLTGATCVFIFVFLWGKDKGIKELQRGSELKLPRLLGPMLGVVTPTIFLIILLSWITQNFLLGNLGKEIQQVIAGKSGAIIPIAWGLAVALFYTILTIRKKRQRR